ncbi:MAG: filamentous hemagglutinin N-terminal domain-containing protein [Rhodocyclaceae bacterium]
MQSETCRKTTTPISRTLIATAVAACFAPLVFALPVAPSVVNGSASFAQNGNTLTVTNSNQAIINWQSFSIGSKEITRFVQPSANSSVLNRVLGNDPSQLLGALQSNGRVFLINPAGVLVGQGARVDVAGFAASTLNLSNSDFLANRLRFGETPGAGKVQNLGEITTPSGGSVYLVAAQVDNGGIISAPNGEVLLAAGQRVELIDTATPGVRVAVVGSEGNATNLGTITAEAGRIGIAGVLVRNSGTLNASSVVSEGGRIFLKASSDTLLTGDSRISATGAKGGDVEVLGQRVALTDNARIDASGRNGGGSVLVGGDYQGKNAAIQNSRITYFGKEASIQADALENGDGGKVIVWADDTTRFAGSINARGGAKGGNGGNAEVSGKAYLDFKGTVDLSAKAGVAGTLLLDPTNITIGANADLNGDTTLGDDVTTDVLVGDNPAATSQITAAQVGTLLDTTSLSLAASNDITVSSAINKTTNTANITLILNAGNAIALNAPISAAAGGLSVELMAGAGGISQTAGIVTAEKLKITSSGNVNLTEGNLVGTLAASMSAGSLSFSNAQSLEIASIGGTNGIIFTGNSNPINISTSAGNLTLYQPILADGLGGGMITLTAANAIDLQAAITASNNSTPAGPVKLTAGAGGITSNAFGIITADALAVRSGGNVALDNAVNMVDKLAASVSGTNSNFKFVNGKALKVDTGPVVDNLTGISLTGIVGNYDSVNPNGVISLRAVDSPSSPTVWYPITQSAGALLAGKAVHAIGSTVDLQADNPTGVIAGEASGGSFKYKSSSPIFVTSVGSSLGIQNTGSGGDIVLTSTNDGVGQDQPISTKDVAGGGGFGLSLSSTADVMLQNVGNNFAVLSANVSTGSLAVHNSEDFTVGTVDAITGISTNNTNILLAAGTNKTLTVSNAINAGASGSVSLLADSLVLSNGITAAMVDIRPVTPGRPISVGSNIGGGHLNVIDLWQINAPSIGIGSDDVIKAAGAIAVSGITVGGTSLTDRHANTTRIGLLSGAGVTQSGAIDVHDLGISAGGTVDLSSANSVSKLAGKTSAGNFTFANSTGFEVTSMSGGTASHAYAMNGISTGGGNVSLTASAGDITLNQPINAGSGTVSLTTSSGSIQDNGNTAVNDVIAGSLTVSATGTSSFDAWGIAPTVSSGTNSIRTVDPAVTAANAAAAAAAAAAETQALADAKAAAEAKALADAEAAAETKALADAQAAAEAKALADAAAAVKALAEAEVLKAKEEAAVLTRVTEETVAKVAVVEAVVGAQTRTAAAMTPAPVALLRTETSGGSGTLFAGRSIGGSAGEFGAPSPDSQPVLTPFVGSTPFSGQAAPAGGLEIEGLPSESRPATSSGSASSKSASDKANQKSEKEATDDAKVAKKKPAQCT